MEAIRLQYMLFLLFKNPGLFFKKAIERFKKSRKILASQSHRQDGRAARPREIHFCITNKCNLRCPMCGQWGKTGTHKTKKTGKELSLAELKGVIDEVAAYKPDISIWGGEPLLRPDLFEFIGYVKKNHMRCSMVTNGTLLNKNAEKLVASNLDYLFVSIDGPERIHDAIRGPGAFQKAIAGIRLVCKLRDEKKKYFPRVNLNTLIMENTYPHLAELLDTTRRLGVDQENFIHAWSIPKTLGHKHAQVYRELFSCAAESWLGFGQDNSTSLNTPALVKVIRQINQLRGKLPNFHITFFPDMSSATDIHRYYTNAEYAVNRTRCLSPWLRLEIKPEGEAVFCMDYPDYSLGNIRTSALLSLWNNPRALDFRKKLRILKKYPICSRCYQLYLD